jgi:hypothetical protein
VIGSAGVADAGTNKAIWYILTDVGDQNVADELGLNFSAKLTFASQAARTGPRRARQQRLR